MSHSLPAAASAGHPVTAHETGARTRALLTAGAVAGPLWIAVAGLQAMTRDGFDLTRHPVSVLSNGELGWIQITNFIVCGLLFVAAGAGMRQRLTTGPGATWAPRLILLVGFGMIGAGVFVADPVDGFPAGTPLGRPEEISWHGGLHFLAATISFISLIGAAFLMARRFSAERRRALARFSAASGVLFLGAWGVLLSSPESAAGSVGLAIGAALILIWASTVCARLAKAEGAQAGSPHTSGIGEM